MDYEFSYSGPSQPRMNAVKVRHKLASTFVCAVQHPCLNFLFCEFFYAKTRLFLLPFSVCHFLPPSSKNEGAEAPSSESFFVDWFNDFFRSETLHDRLFQFFENNIRSNALKSDFVVLNELV